jgi:beta-xylosidase
MPEQMHNILTKFLPVLFLAMVAVSSILTPPQNSFQPGQPWVDTAGHTINCHGGGFLFYNGTYYWYGELKSANRHGGHIGVACYSSTDLYNWKNEGEILGTSSSGTGDLITGCIIERPKVLFNAKTKKFVLWFHFEKKGEGYGTARAAVATCDAPTGAFTYLGSFRMNAGQWPVNFPQELRHPLAGKTAESPDDILRRDFSIGQMSRDMTLFVDDDGSAYQITASEENATLHLSKLTDDYLKPAGPYVRIFPGGNNEAPALFKHGGHYYLITSGTTGWRPNAARLAVADTITGPWKPLGNPCVGSEEDTKLTFHSQAAAVLKLDGKPDALIYVGDRWNPRDLPNSRYIWLPISFTDEHPSIAWKDKWDLSVFDENRVK